MSLEYKILGQELVSYTDIEGTTDTTSYYVSYEETGGPLFVAVGTQASVAAHSTDGITWTEANLPNWNYWTSVAYGNGKFVAVSTFSLTSAYSTDGITWTSTTQVHPSLTFVMYADNKFVAVGNSGGQVPDSVYSTDGVSWTLATFPLSYFSWSSVAYGNEIFVAVSSSLNGNRGRGAAYSTDGITWTIMENALPLGYWVDVAYGDNKFVAVASQFPTAAYSTDGITWTEISLPNLSSETVAYGDGKFVALSSYGGTAAYSADGITWTQTSLPEAYWSSLVYADGKFVALSYYAGTAAYSADGITWTQASLSGSAFWRSVAFGQTTQLVETLNIIGGQGTSSTEEFLPITVYTVPTGKQTTVTSIFVANHDDTDSTYDLAVVPAGEDLSLKHHIRWDMAVAAKDFENISTKITMSAGDKLVIFPSTADTVSITAFGVEK